MGNTLRHIGKNMENQLDPFRNGHLHFSDRIPLETEGWNIHIFRAPNKRLACKLVDSNLLLIIQVKSSYRKM